MDINNINRLLIYAWGNVVPVSFSDERAVRAAGSSHNHANFRHAILPGVGRFWERLPGSAGVLAPGGFDRTNQSIVWQLKWWSGRAKRFAYQSIHNLDDNRREIQFGVRSSIEGGLKISVFPTNGRFLVGGTWADDGTQILFDPAIGGVHDAKYSAYRIGTPGNWDPVIEVKEDENGNEYLNRLWRPVGMRIQAKVLPEDWDVVANPSPALSDFSDWTTILEYPFDQARIRRIQIDRNRRASYDGAPVYDFENMLKIPMITLTAGPPE